jgi:maleamate amidohydrolase
MAAALLVIDLQKDFFEKEYSDQVKSENIKKNLGNNINHLLGAARKSQIPIIFVLTSLLPDQSNWNLRMKDIKSAVCLKGTDGEALISSVKIEENDICIFKERYSAFYKTNLEEILFKQSIKSLIICGINTHACVRTTAIDAFMRDYRVFIPIECVASYEIEQHESSLKYMSKRIAKVLSLQEMIDRIRETNFDFRFIE